MNRQKFDIAIVGSSFAGMTCALTLAQISPQISIALIEKENIFDKFKHIMNIKIYKEKNNKWDYNLKI